MNDKTEQLNSALGHTRKAMQEIDCVASIIYSEHNSTGDVFDQLDDIYRTMRQAKQKMAELKV